MNVLLEQMKYDGWANGRVLDVISHLAPEAFARMLPGSFPSIQQTLVHILWAEELWLERWQGRPFKSALDAGSYPTVESVRAGLEDVHARQIEFLCGDAALPDRIVGYMNFKGERWEYSIRQMVQHLMIHSGYHRGQLATLLRQQGAVAPSTDYLVFVDSSSS